jgi:hypothetical protein
MVRGTGAPEIGTAGGGRGDDRPRRIKAMEGLSELLATADELYGLLPEEFTAAREERVRALRRNGSRARALAVKELRRPSVAAWLVNALVRHRRAEVEQLLAVGEAMREAQRSLDSGQLRELNRQRQLVLGAIGRQARELARELGRPVSDQVGDEVEETLRAALADPAAASAVLSGRLTGSLRYAGFGVAGVADVADPADVAAASGTNGSTSTAAPDADDEAVSGSPLRGPSAADREAAQREGVEGEERARRVAARQAALREATIMVRAAEEAARRAEGAALVAEQHGDALLRREASARQRLDHAHGRVAELESQLASARQQVSAAAAGWAPLHAEAEAAGHRADTARGLADSTRATLRSARAHLTDVEGQGLQVEG